MVAGLSHQAKDAAIWWDDIDKLREKYGDDTDAIVEALSDSGKYPSWDIKIGASLITTLKRGSELEQEIASKNRRVVDAGGILKGRQIYARILKVDDIDEEGEALANLEDIMAVQLVDDDIVGFKLHFQYVWGSIHPEMRESLKEPALRRLAWRQLSKSNKLKPEIKAYYDIKKRMTP